MAESKGYNLGVGYLHATISFDGIGKQIAQEMRKAQKPAQEGGKDAGERFEGGFRKGVSSVAERAREAIRSPATVAAAGASGAAAGAAWSQGFKRALDTNSISKSMGGLFAGLSGGRVVKDLATGFRDFAKNLDRTVPKLGLVSSGIGAIAGAGIAGIGGILGVSNALGSIAAVALTLPGLIGAGAASIAVFSMAIADVTTVLADLGPAFVALQDSVSASFWARAEQPIRNLADNVLPILQNRMSEVAHEMGGFAVAIANTLNSSLGLAQLDQMFVYLRDSLDTAGDGVGALTNAIMTLGLVGSSYLPDLASWFNRISFSFEDWAERSAASGDIFRWIDTGITNLKALGMVLVNTVGIFHALGTAAEAAGAGGLVGLAAGLGRVNDALHTDEWQAGLASMFSGASEAMSRIGDGFGMFARGLLDAGGVLREGMILSGDAIGSLLSLLGGLFSSPAVQGGLATFFAGTASGAASLESAAAPLGAVLGGLMEIMGTMSATLGDVVTRAISAVAPALVSLMDGIRPLIPALGEIVASIIEGLAPVLSTVANIIQNVFLPPLVAMFGWIADNSGLVTGLATVVGTIAAVLGTAALAVSAFQGALAVLRGVMVGVNIVMAMNPFVLVAAAIAGLVVAVVLAYNKIGWFRDFVDTVWAAIKTAFSATIGWITGTAFPALMAGLQWVGDKFVWLNTNVIQPVWNWIKGAISNVVDWFTGTVVPNFNTAVNAVGGFFDFLYRNFIAPFVWLFKMAILAVTAWFRDTVVPTFNKAVTAIGDVFRWLNTNVIQPVWTWIQNKIGAFVRWFEIAKRQINAKIWELAVQFQRFYNETIRPIWDWIRAKIDGVVRWFRDVLVPAFRAAIQRVVDKFNNFESGVNNVWENVKTLLRAGWNWIDSNVFQKFRDGLDVLKDAFTKAKDGIGTAWDKLKAKVKEPIAFVVNEVINPFIGGYNKLNNFWSGDDLGKIEGFATGGYTGPGAKYKPAGVVHADEFVIRKESQNDLRKKAPGLLDGLNKYGSKALGYATGGLVGKRDNPAHAAPGARVYGGMGSFTNTLQHAIARMGELNVLGAAPGYSLPGAINMLDQATPVTVKRGSRMGSNSVHVGLESTPDWWGGYYSNYGIRLNTRTSSNMAPTHKRTLLAHELGHALGLPHSARQHGGNGAWSIMNYDNQYKHNSVTSADVAALSAIYGGSGKASSPGEASGDDGNVWLDQLKKLVTKPIDSAKSAFSGNKFLEMPLGLANKAVSGVIDKAASLIGLGGDDDGPAGNSQVTAWMTTALKKKGLFSDSNLQSGVRRAMQESGGDPRAVNNWDVNALRGDPSKGLMQTIGATFRQYMEPGHSDIFNAIDNILASINYTMARYGSLRAGWDRPGGYADGGLVKAPYADQKWDDPVGTVHKLSPGVSSIYNGTGGDEFFQRVTPGGNSGITFNGDVYTVSPEELFRTYEKRAERRRSLANVA